MASRFARTLVVTPYRCLLHLIWKVRKPPRQVAGPRRVLLCAATEMMTSYANAAAKLISDRDDVATYFTRSPAAGITTASLGGFAESLGHRVIPYWRARMQWWDLIIFSEYRAADRFHPDAPKVLVNHFLGGGKMVDGKEYRFERPLVHLGRPTFRKIFDASFASRDRAVAGDPALADQIAVVGDLRSDELLEMKSRREEIRQSLGFEPGQKVVLVQSTWGPQSIMERWGSALLEEALQLQQRSNYRFIASTHPLHWTGRRVAEHPWGKHLLSLQPRGLKVVRPEDDWAEGMIASDMVITDNTSLSATYCQLGKPLIYIDELEEYIPEGSTVGELYKISPHLHEAAELEGLLHQMQQDYPYEQLSKIAYEVNSFPGEATERIRAELLEVLGLSK